jgi:glycyl-tRNA synthetase
MADTSLMDKVVSLCKRRGFVFPGSDIYGGLANTWDYGPYGVTLKKNVKDTWWKYFVEDRDDMVGLDAAILMNPKTWEASGHIASFSDPLVDCKKCKKRFRGDKLLEEKIGNGAAASIKLKDIHGKLIEENIHCPDCGKMDWTEAKTFNLMFKTYQGVIEDATSQVYLRPETAQGIFVNFRNVVDTCRVKIPFGIGQIGKAFRNEITPGNFTFRTREFEQMEIEYFCKPDDKKKLYKEWKEQSKNFFVNLLGIREDNLRFREHDKEELSHYSNMTFDIEYRFPFGSIHDGNETWGELQGLADRGDFDLAQHEKFSGKDLKYRDPVTNEVYLPHVIEPSFGLDRTVLTVLIDAFSEEKLEDGSERTVMKFKPSLAPVQVAVFPLLKNKEELVSNAKEVHKELRKHFRTEWDDNGNIGKRYRRQDEIGTPYCVTFDFESLEDKSVTIRDRDTMKQERVKIKDLVEHLQRKIAQ